MPDKDLFPSSLAEHEAAAIRRDLAASQAELEAVRGELNALNLRRSVRAALFLADRIAPLRRAIRAARRPRSAPGEVPRSASEDPQADASAEPPDPPRFYWPSLTHHHSPVPDTRVLSRESTRRRVWPQRAPEIPAVDWHAEQQLQLLGELGRQTPMRIPEERTSDPKEFFAPNPSFGHYDSWASGAMLRHLRPSRMIEIGVNREYLGGQMNLTCIDPYPVEFMQEGVEGVSSRLVHPVEETPLSTFEQLEEGDVLFIDSTHTVKTGGDVVFLFGEVIPSLRPGVVLHVHDIFLPRDYPQPWALSGWSWNEQYLVQAFLSFNAEFEILLAMAWLADHHPEAVVRAAPPTEHRHPRLEASLWFRRRLWNG